jgi:hypothetical protein
MRPPLTCKNGHPKTKKNWRVTPSGHPYCDPCQRASNARRAERLKKLDTTAPMAATGASLPAISKDDVGGEAERVLIETMRRTKSEKTRVQVATHIRKEIAPTGGGTVAAKELAAMMAQREADMEALHNPANLLEVIRHCQAARILPSTDESPAATPELVEAEPAPPLLLEEAPSTTAYEEAEVVREPCCCLHPFERHASGGQCGDDSGFKDCSCQLYVPISESERR